MTITTATRRLAATAVDYALAAAWVAALLLVGLTLRATGLTLSSAIDSPVPRVAAQLAAAAILSIPITLWLASREWSPRHATPGKRLLGLTVETTTGRSLTRRRILARNALKILLPWELAHTAIWDMLTWPGPPSSGLDLALLAAACALPLANVLTLFTGHTLYDRLCRTTVTHQPAT